MNRKRLAGAVLMSLVITLPVDRPRAQGPDVDLPVFEVEPSWPMLPNDWVLGQVASVTVDGSDQVWVLHRPRTVPDEEQAVAAPPVLVFDIDGTFVRAWGGPGDGYEWPANEHGIHADHEGNIWIGGNGSDPASDDMLLKFTPDGELLLQIGRRGQSGGNADTENLMRPAESFVYPETNEVFVADGYGNRRVIVLDAQTGAFKRMWGGFGGEPRDPQPAPARAAGGGSDVPRGEGPGPQQFGTVHGIEVSLDGRVYVADRNNGRIQRFTLDGAFLEQRFVNPDGESALTVAGMAFSGDWEQMFIYVADQGNSLIHVLDRQTLEVLDSFGRNGEGPGDFRALHHIATDSQGNIYTAEAQRGRRAQKFKFFGMASWF